MTDLINNRYQLLQELGRGSMGTVHRGRDTLLDRDVAIKMMRIGPSVDSELKERFYREARLYAQLHHPNLVTVYDLGEHEGAPYIAMEMLVGVDWRRIIQRENSLIPVTRKLDFIAQVCDGLACAHEHTVIHRDLKPSNLFIHQNQQSKILDFGLARLPSSNLTVTGRVLGTPNYMAPEQILGEKCDSRSDLFSAALVFFEFLAGAHPFESPLIPRRIACGDPDSLTVVEPSLPEGLSAIFDRALARSPESRYQDAAELADDFRVIAADLPRDEDLEPDLRAERKENSTEVSNSPAEKSSSQRVARARVSSSEETQVSLEPPSDK